MTGFASQCFCYFSPSQINLRNRITTSFLEGEKEKKSFLIFSRGLPWDALLSVNLQVNSHFWTLHFSLCFPQAGERSIPESKYPQKRKWYAQIIIYTSLLILFTEFNANFFLWLKANAPPLCKDLLFQTQRDELRARWICTRHSLGTIAEHNDEAWCTGEAEKGTEESEQTAYCARTYCSLKSHHLVHQD